MLWRRAVSRFFRSTAVAAAAWMRFSAVYAAALPSAPMDVSMVVGEDRAVVVEHHQRELSAGQSVALFRLPGEIDVSTISLSDPDGVARLLDLRVRPFESVAKDRPNAVWPLQTTAPVRPQAWLVEARIRGPGGVRRLDVMYSTDRLAWRANYDVVVRGDISNLMEPLSVDLEGRCIISNGLAVPFESTRIRFKGAAPGIRRPATENRPDGFLWLDPDSPLAELWRPRRPEPEPPVLYVLPERVALPAGGEAAIRFAQLRRAPAERVFLMESERVPQTGSWYPLHQVLAFANDRRAGLGVPLPPGHVRVASGAGRLALLAEGRLPHTPSGSPLRIEIGPMPGVVGARRSLGRSRSAAGFAEETIELRLMNQLASDVRVEIVERPPAPLGWDVTRSTLPYRTEFGRLRMEIRVPAQREERATYTVRLKEPEG